MTRAQSPAHPALSAHPSPVYQLSYEDYLRFRQLVLKHSGLNFTEKKRADLEAGLLKAVEQAPDGIADVTAYYRFLEQATSPEARSELDRLINLLTVGETYFFRDSAQFDMLAQQVLPAIISRKRNAAAAGGLISPGAPQLRIWSAGAASGEEPYSLAILLRELIPDIEQWQILILATDINRDVLARAKEGVYSDWSFREGQAKARRSLYFSQRNNRYQLQPDIRRMVTFAYHNLIDDDFPSIHNNITAMDLILCRNVTIYFTEETTRLVIEKFHRTLVEGGWLVVGHAEPSLVTYRDFHTHTFTNTILYQKLAQAHAGANNGIGKTPAGLQWSQPASQPDPAILGSRANLQTGILSAMSMSPPGLSPSEDPLTPPEADLFASVQQMAHRGQMAEAVAALESSLPDMAAPKRPEAYCTLARLYADRGGWEQARHWAKEAIKLDALCVDAYFIQALVDEHQGNLQAAIDNLNKVIYLDRARPLPHFNLAILYKKTGQISHARRALRNLIKTLAQWPPEETIPDSGDTDAQRLLETAELILADLQGTDRS